MNEPAPYPYDTERVYIDQFTTPIKVLPQTLNAFNAASSVFQMSTSEVMARCLDDFADVLREDMAKVMPSGVGNR